MLTRCWALLTYIVFFSALLAGSDSHGATSNADSASNDRNATAKELAQTIASLFSITIQNYFIASQWDRPGTANVVDFRTLIPFKVWDQENLLRLDLPFRTQSALGPGLADSRLFDLLMFQTEKINWGVGPVFNLGVNRGPGVDAFQTGPAAAVTYSNSPAFSFGLLNQNFLSGQVTVTTLQPILVYNPGPVWTISLGELPLVYNWRKSQFAVFSVGLQVGALVKIARQPVRFFVNPQYNTKSSTELYQWTIASGMTLPLKSPAP